MLEGKPLIETPAWSALQAHYEKIKDTTCGSYSRTIRTAENTLPSKAQACTWTTPKIELPMKPFDCSCSSR